MLSGNFVETLATSAVGQEQAMAFFLQTRRYRFPVSILPVDCLSGLKDAPHERTV